MGQTGGGWGEGGWWVSTQLELLGEGMKYRSSHETHTTLLDEGEVNEQTGCD